MKFKKIVSLILIGVITVTCLTGCGSKKIEKAHILTTTYALQYLVDNLSVNKNNNSTIYPAGVNTDDYTLTDKQINTFARKNNIFVYNGLTKERKIALSLINTNSNLTVIDCTKGMSIINDGEEFTLVLRKGADYHLKLAVKAGKYKLISFEPNVKVKDLPKTLELKGYFYELSINII